MGRGVIGRSKRAKKEAPEGRRGVSHFFLPVAPSKSRSTLGRSADAKESRATRPSIHHYALILANPSRRRRAGVEEYSE